MHKYDDTWNAVNRTVLQIVTELQRKWRDDQNASSWTKERCIRSAEIGTAVNWFLNIVKAFQIGFAAGHRLNNTRNPSREETSNIKIQGDPLVDPSKQAHFTHVSPHQFTFKVYLSPHQNTHSSAPLNTPTGRWGADRDVRHLSSESKLTFSDSAQRVVSFSVIEFLFFFRLPLPI